MVGPTNGITPVVELVSLKILVGYQQQQEFGKLVLLSVVAQ